MKKIARESENADETRRPLMCTFPCGTGGPPCIDERISAVVVSFLLEFCTAPTLPSRPSPVCIRTWCRELVILSGVHNVRVRVLG